MSNKNTIPFMVGAITGAGGLATVALLCSDNNSDSEKTYKQDIDEIIKQLNRLFFVASGMSLKIQVLFGKISSAEMAEIKYSFSGLYSRQKDRVENYFYYLDHVEEFEEIQDVYRQLIGHPATTARAVTLNLPPTDVRAVQKGTLIPKSSPAVTLVTPL